VEGVGSSGPTPTDVLSARAGPPTLLMAFGSSYYVPTKGLHLRNIKLTCLHLCRTFHLVVRPSPSLLIKLDSPSLKHNLILFRRSS